MALRSIFTAVFMLFSLASISSYASTQVSSCSNLFLESKLITAYQKILQSQIGTLISIDELNHMLSTGDYFTLVEHGQSEKTHVRKTLFELKDAMTVIGLTGETLNARLSEIVHELYQQQKDKSSKQNEVQKKRSEAKSGFVAINPDDAPFRDVVLFNNDRWVATKYQNTSELIVWDTYSGNLIRKLKEEFRTAPLIISADSKYLVTIHSKLQTGVWDAMTGNFEYDLPDRYDVFGGPILFDQRGDLLAYTTHLIPYTTEETDNFSPRITKVWSMKQKKIVFETPGYFRGMSSNGELILVHSTLYKNFEKSVELEDSCLPTSVQFSEDGQVIAGRMPTQGGGPSDQLLVWNTADGKLLWKSDHNKEVANYVLCPANKLLWMSQDTKKTIPNSWGETYFDSKLVNLKTGELIHTFSEQTSSSSTASFSKSGRLIAISSEEAISVWDTTTMQKTHEFHFPETYFHQIIFTQDEKRLLVNTAKVGIRIFELTND